MKPQRIHITGASGSGTTTLGQSLASRLHFAFFDADDYFWKPTEMPYTEKRSREERLSMLLQDLEVNPGHVLSGSICGWGRQLEASFDLVVFLVIAKEVRMKRLIDRETRRFGRVDPSFIEWAARYDDGDTSIRSRALHESWLAELACNVLRLPGDMPINDLVDAICTNVTQSPRPINQ
jgi:adenylate kinase family enzyme